MLFIKRKRAYVQVTTLDLEDSLIRLDRASNEAQLQEVCVALCKMVIDKEVESTVLQEKTYLCVCVECVMQSETMCVCVRYTQRERERERHSRTS